jgi:hypothetical protein
MPSPPAPLPRCGRGVYGRTAVRPAARSPSPALRERGTQGVRAKRRACPSTPAQGKSHPPQRFCTEPLYPYQLTPSPSPTLWERGAAAFGVLKRQLQRRAEAPPPHAISSLNPTGQRQWVAPTRRYVIPIARAEFTIAPLREVPPASRGEPRTGSVPPAGRGNLKEGVLGVLFWELCLCESC